MFQRVNAIGWVTDEVLTSPQMNLLDEQLSNAVDGKGGGDYTLDASIGLAPADDLGSGGNALTVPPALVLVGGRMTSSAGGAALAAVGGAGTRPGPAILAQGSDEGNISDDTEQGMGLYAQGSGSGPGGIIGGLGIYAKGGNAQVLNTFGGYGLRGIGGNSGLGTGGYGVHGVGGSGSDAAHGGAGGRFEGTGAGHGAIFVGGNGGGHGLEAFAVGGNAYGVYARGWGLGPGLVAEAAPSSNGAGGYAHGAGTGPGLTGLGGGAGTTAFGLIGLSANVGSGGVWGVAFTGDNIQGGLVGWGSPDGGPGGYGAKLVGSASRAALRLEPTSVGVPPSVVANGDVWTDGFELYARLGGQTYKLDKTAV